MPLTPDAGDKTAASTEASTGMPTTQLRLRPGEASELVVQITNPGDRPRQISYTLSGDFPRDWCRVGGIEGREILPRQQMSLVLYFQVELDFFEKHDAIRPGGKLALDYRGQLQIASLMPGQAKQETQICPFRLHIRPDSLYLNFLPDFYREVDLIGRLLKIFELGFEPAVQTLDTLWAHLNPLTAPQSMLDFLAHWVGWPSDVPWDVNTQRQLIRRAMLLYRLRGTMRGLRLYLHLYTGLSLDQPDTPEEERQIQIQEVFDDDFIVGQARLGVDTILGGGRPYHFIVRLRSPQPDRLDRRLIHTIIQQEKPAFCSYDMSIEAINRPITPS